MNASIKTYLAAAAALFCASAQAAPYHVVAPMSDDDEGAMVYLVNYDTGQRIDSVLVDQGSAEFRGEIDEPVLARLLLDGQRYATFILEEGGTAINKERNATGSMLNDRLNAITDEINNLGLKFRAATSEQEQQAIYADYNKLLDAALDENADNPIGYYLFLDKAGGLSRSEFAEAIAKYPAMARYERVKRYQQSFDRQEATAEGKPFTDFEIEYNGTTHRLSDVVGHGDYVLVDYWASWCGPCIRQTAVIKDIYNEYKDKGLKVLGVAVWDEPDATLAAIEKHQLPWECWLNGQSIPTDLYGIMGIPCIILYGPDGTILSRDKQSDELKAAVRAAIDKN
ncbi:MAG: AhpC/TSA family protein [Bacteroides sp.]|nr:AhpC/TSA family protein [Bacteroides sp.]